MAAIIHDISVTPDLFPARALINHEQETLPEADYYLIGDGITIAGSVGTAGYLNVIFSAEVEGILQVYRLRGIESFIEEYLNHGNPIPAGGVHPETIEVTPGENINFGFSATGGTYKLRVISFIQR